MSSLFIFLTVVQAIVAALLVGVILVQQSEGGGLGTGGSPTGFMSARGAADFLTRATGVLAGVFVLLSIALAALAVNAGTGRTIDTSLQRAAPAPADPLAGQAVPPPAGAPVQGAPVQGAPIQRAPADPLAAPAPAPAKP